jgi:hypothetical protein
MENLDQTPQAETPKRPVFLTVLCILTLIVTSFGVMGGLKALLDGPVSVEVIENSMEQFEESAQLMEDMGSVSMAGEFRRIMNLLTYTNANFSISVTTSLLTSAIGLISALLMLRGRKNGFHLYIIYNLVSLVGVYAYVPVREVPVSMLIINALISSLFIFMYSRNLSYLNK